MDTNIIEKDRNSELESDLIGYYTNSKDLFISEKKSKFKIERFCAIQRIMPEICKIYLQIVSRILLFVNSKHVNYSQY